jgi:phospholipase A1/A2
MKTLGITILLASVTFTGNIVAQESEKPVKPVNKQVRQDNVQDRCLLKALKAADLEDTVKVIKDRCDLLKKPNAGVITERIAQEQATAFNPYVLTPHKMNYLLPATHTDDVNRRAYQNFNDWADYLEQVEAKLQISFKVPLNTGDLFLDDDAFYFGFTLQSWWQVYSENMSKPFRETNYQPEFFYRTPLEWSLGDSNSAFMVGIEHQSNGRSQALSRSWNRLYFNWLFEYDDFALSFKPWYRLPEDKKTDPNDSDGDDNPDIEDYLGFFELGLAYKWDDYEFMFRGHQNFSTHRGGAELGFTFPLWGKLRGYAQYYGGYGESLIDYNHSQNRFGIGIALTDAL